MEGNRVCFATLLTTDSYLDGALVLAASIRATKTQHGVVCLVADGQISSQTYKRLEQAFDRVIDVPILDTKDVDRLALLGRPDLGTTVTKIGIWSLAEYQRVVYLDADTLVLTSIDSLLDLSCGLDQEDVRPNGGMHHEGLLGAAPDLGWPDCFNSGVLVIKPSISTHSDLLQLFASQGSFDGKYLPNGISFRKSGDQGLLNAYFDDWSRADHSRRLPFAFNATSTSFYTYAPALAHFGRNIKVVHFVGPNKPWKVNHNVNNDQDNCSTYNDLMAKWWAIYDVHVSIYTPDHDSTNVTITSSKDEEDEEKQSVSSSNNHVMDGAWKKESRTSPIHVEATEEIGNDKDVWGKFISAADFSLS